MGAYRGLLSALRDGVSGGQRRTAERQLRLPWCWPADTALAAKARALGFEPPAPPRPGEVLLLCATVDQGEPSEAAAGALYGCLAAPRRAWPAELRQRALEDQLEVARRAEGALFALGRLPFLHEPPPARLERATPARGGAVQGCSFRLAFLLGAVSWIAQRAVPATVAATANVDLDTEDLSLRPVDGLNAKLHAVADHALAVREVWVASGQLQEAQAMLPELARPLRVRGAERAGEVVEAIWGALPATPTLDAEELARRIDELHLACLDATARFQGWDRVAEMVRSAAHVPEVNPETVRKAKVVEAICTRHSGRPLPWPDVAPGTDARPLRLLEATQRLQHGLDAGASSAELDARLASARALLAPPSDRHREDWILLSAMGRATSSLAREAEGSPMLREALAGMARLGLWGDTSFALSELARVSGILHDRAGVEHVEALDRHRRWAIPPGEARRASDLFVDLALGRARAQLGDTARAVERLEPVASARFSPHVTEAAELWRAKAELAAGRADARSRLEALAARPVEHQGHNARLLARLALARMDDDAAAIEAALAAYDATWPGETARMFPGVSGRALADALAERARY